MQTRLDESQRKLLGKGMLSRDSFKAALFIILLFIQTFSFGCPLCHNPTGQIVREGIIHIHFWLILGSIFFIFTFYVFIVIMICYVLPFLFNQKNHIHSFEADKQKRSEIQRLFFSGMILAAGLFGFLDGIIFHQILQLHSMVSNILPLDTVANLEINMFWDGVFHLFSLGIMLFGIILTIKVIKNISVCKINWPLLNRSFLGSILLGGGIFNLIEGVMDHQLLTLHQVVQRSPVKEQFYFDILFLLVAVFLIIIGIFIIKKNGVMEQS